MLMDTEVTPDFNTAIRNYFMMLDVSHTSKSEAQNSSLFIRFRVYSAWLQLMQLTVVSYNHCSLLEQSGHQYTLVSIPIPTPLHGLYIATLPQCLQVLNQLNINSKVKTFAKRWAQAAKHKDWDRQTYLIKSGNCTKCPKTGDFVIAPVLDGRIKCVGEECPVPHEVTEVKLE